MSNTVAGIGNTVLQGATVLQHSGGWFGQPNFANVQNLAVAAGIGNFAGQSALVRQR